MALNQSKAFSLREIPSLDGRVAIVTGGTSLQKKGSRREMFGHMTETTPLGS